MLRLIAQHGQTHVVEVHPLLDRVNVVLDGADIILDGAEIILDGADIILDCADVLLSLQVQTKLVGDEQKSRAAMTNTF